MENSGIREKIMRYKQCSYMFWEYLEKVLLRIPEEIRNKEILDDLTFDIISIDGKLTSGQYYSFSNPVKHIIILNSDVLSTPEYNIIHTIAHEIAHKVAGKGETGLYEMEAEQLLMQWGFKEESEKVNYYRPIAENTGFEIGYEWAKKQTDLSMFEEYYDKWNSEEITLQEWDEILDALDIISQLEKFGLAQVGEPIDINAYSASKEDMPMDIHFDKAFVQGVMSFLKIKRNKHSGIF